MDFERMDDLQLEAAAANSGGAESPNQQLSAQINFSPISNFQDFVWYLSLGVLFLFVKHSTKFWTFSAEA